MNKITFYIIFLLLLGFLFFESETAFCQISIDENININLTAKKALQKKFKRAKITVAVKNGFITNREINISQESRYQVLDTLDDPYTILIKLGLSNKIINNTSPRDSFLILFPYAEKINDTMYYLFKQPPQDTSFLHLPNMGSHPWSSPQTIVFDTLGLIKSINSGGGSRSECCGGGDSWFQIVWFKGNICYSSTTHTQRPGEEVETEWDPTHTFPLTVIKNKGNIDTYSKSTYSYVIKKGIICKVIETVENKAFSENKTILFKYHYKR